MTGYGRGEAADESVRVVVEVKTVNHRHLDIRVTLPRSLSALEPSVVARIRGQLGRGRVEAHVRMEPLAGAESGWIKADLPAARALHGALIAVQNDLGLPGDLDVTAMARLSERLVRTEQPDGQDVLPSVEAAVGLALDDVIGARAAEGRALGDDIRRRAASLRGLVASIAARCPELIEAWRERLRGRLATLLEGTGVAPDPARLAQEVAVLADRSDVSEELERLTHHLDTLEGLLAGTADDRVGRRIDFLAQELAREANTVASKVADAEVAALVVEVKAEIERIREQAQNLE